MTQLRRGAVPPDYREVLYWRVPRGGWPLIVGHVLSFGLAAVSGLFFFWFAIRFGRLRGIETGTASLVALLVARYPARARVIDERDGMRIFLPA